MQEARTRKQDLYVAWLDFSDAFGSIPHAALTDSLRHYGISDYLSPIIQDMYTDASTHVVSSDGVTAPIQIRSGIHQGDPLSSILFNIAINPILERIHNSGDVNHQALSFADDLTPMDETYEGLQNKINIINYESQRLSIQLNPKKCVSLHLSGKTPVGSRPSIFRIEDPP